MYGQRKAIAKRTPLFPANSRSKVVLQESSGASSSTVTPGTTTPLVEADLADILSTPAATEGETATETELETETEIEEENHGGEVTAGRKQSKHQPQLSTASSVSAHSGISNDSTAPRYRRKAISQHDLLNKYFRRDAVVLRNIDLLRSGTHPRLIPHSANNTSPIERTTQCSCSS